VRFAEKSNYFENEFRHGKILMHARKNSNNRELEN
jgi:hypothetical protein